MFDKECTYDLFISYLKQLIKMIEEKDSREGPRAHSVQPQIGKEKKSMVPTRNVK